MRKVTTGPTSVTAAAASAGVWIAMATRWPAHAPTALQTVVGKNSEESGVLCLFVCVREQSLDLLLRHHGGNNS